MERLFAGLLAMLLCVTPACAVTWRVASSSHFVMYSQEAEADLKVRAEKLERFDSALRRLMMVDDPPVSPSNRLAVYVVPMVSDVQAIAMRRRYGGSNTQGIYGFYHGQAGNSHIVVPQRTLLMGIGTLSPDVVLRHEYGHHFTYRIYDAPFPPWFIEGFAEFVSTASIKPDDSVVIGLAANQRAGILFNGGYLPFRQIVTASYKNLTSPQVEELYGQGWLLTHMCIFSPTRFKQLAAYLQDIRSGTPLAKAAERFGDLGELERALAKYKRGKLTALTMTAGTLHPAPVTIQTLSLAASAAMMAKIRSRAGVTAVLAKSVQAEIRRVAARAPDDAFVQRAATEAEFDAGDLDAADAAADRALKADPKLHDAMMYKGRIAVARAVKDKSQDAIIWRRARRWFLDANAVENDDPEPLAAFYASYELQGRPPPINAVQALYWAQTLAPEDQPLRFIVARQRLRDGQPAEARAALVRVAFSPHEGAMAVQAADIVTKIDAHDTAGALAALSSKSGRGSDAK